MLNTLLKKFQAENLFLATALPESSIRVILRLFLWFWGALNKQIGPLQFERAHIVLYLW